MAQASINWYDATVRSLEASHPEARECSAAVVERLSSLMLQRLPRPLASGLIDALPETCSERARGEMRACVRRGSGRDELPEGGDASIGYPDFVEHVVEVARTSGCTELDDLRARRIADTFLWSFAHELSPETKVRLLKALPAELRHRMNLLTSTADEARVA